LVALLWHNRIFSRTNVFLILLIHILAGLSLASWSFFIAAPFGKSPQLAAVSTTLLAVLICVLALVCAPYLKDVSAVIFSVLLPPAFYIFAIRTVCGYEALGRPANIIHLDPSGGLRLLPLIITALV